MLGKKWFAVSSNNYLLIAVIGFIALWFSPFIVSVATVLCGLLFLLNIRSFQFKASKIRLLVVSLVLLAIVVLFDAAYSSFAGLSGDKVGLILGFLFSLFSGLLFLDTSKVRLVKFALILCSAVVVVNLIALTNYFLNKAEIDALLLQSKSIPIPNMHHIHFGIINAMCVILLLGVNLDSSARYSSQKKLAIVFGVFIFISAHVLSSRTGLLSLYVAMLLGATYYASYSKNYVKVGLILMGLALFSVGSYSWSNSLRNKIANSLEDINSWGLSEEINHKSMAMRIEAYKASATVLWSHPLGVGAIKLDDQMEEGYTAISSPLWQENRIGPHNQLLEYGVKYGWIGVGVVLLFFVSLFSMGSRGSYIYFTFMVLLIVSLQFESLLERQTSLYFLALFLPLFIHLFTRKERDE
ncbi:O-antigen ligase family protein [Bacteroidia bacterium]|jgi:hypothetical protein|nr:O-antigen ligase family protein [Bacteroidia bacterium]